MPVRGEGATGHGRVTAVSRMNGDVTYYEVSCGEAPGVAWRGVAWRGKGVGVWKVLVRAVSCTSWKGGRL